MNYLTKLLLISTFLFFIPSQIDAQIYIELAQNKDLTFDEIVEQTELYFADRDKGRGSGYKQFKRWEYFTRRSLDSDGKIIDNFEALQRYNKFVKKNTSSEKTIGQTWLEMGPESATNTSTWSSHIGRVSALGVDPNDADHLVIGSPGGGIWKTTNQGTTWTPIFDDGVVLSVWSIAISHDNNQHYYAGVSGNGVWRSLDGGSTWISTTGTGGTITTLLMNPNDHNILLALRNNGRIYRSTNGGQNWTETDVANVITGNTYDMEFKTNNPNIVYVSGSNGVFKSTDNGVSFTELSGPWQSLPAAYDNQPKMMAVTPHDPNYLYVLGSNSGGFGAVYLSTNSGNAWTTQKDEYCDCAANSSCPTQNIMGYNQGNCGGQAPRDMDIIVSDTDKTEVHVAGVETWKSTDSGLTFTQTTDWNLGNVSLPFVHADIDLMYYLDGTIYFGTDGGLFISDDEAVTVTDLTTGLGIRQFYRIGVSKTELDRVSGGSQDNGTGVLRTGTWYDFVGADGMETFIDKDNEDIIYASIQYGGLYKSSNGGNSLTGITNPPGNGDWVTPLEQDPILANTLYQGRQQVHKSTNGGGAWDEISSLPTPTAGSNRLVEITVAPNNSNVIVAAFQRFVYRTTDGGATLNWTDISPSTGFTNVNYISIHPTDSNRILLSLSGGSSKLLESTDGGSSWTDISSGLPNIGLECAIYENGPGGDDGIYVAMNPGVWYKSLSQPTWDILDVGIPKVRVTELEIQHNLLYAATYGRGLWKTDLIDGLACIVNGITDMGVQECDQTNGVYVRAVEVDYDYAPSGGFLNVNGTDFTITGGPQIVYLDETLDGMSVDVVAYFTDEPSCTLTENGLFNNPTSCPCLLNVDNTMVDNCDTNGTSDPADDTYTISINPEGDYVSATYSVVGDLSASNIAYGTPYIFDNGGNGYPVSNGEISFDIIDDVDPTCSITGVSFITPDNCSSNYFCQDAFELTTNGTYTAIGPSQGGGGSVPGRDANWFVFYPPSDGLLTVRSCLEGVDTRLHLHENNCSNYATLVTIDDNCEMTPGGNTYASEIVDYCLDGTKVYLIEWDDRWSTASFDFEFTFTTSTYYADLDGDTFGDPNNSVMACSQPAGYVMDNTDCDDNDANNFPGNTEVCGDGTDNNCDGNIDEGCSTEPCDGEFLVINTITQNTYRAEATITSDAVLTNTQDILFAAQDEIELTSGFTVPAGAEFEAVIDYCVPTTSTNSNVTISNESYEVLNEVVKNALLNFDLSKEIKMTIKDKEGTRISFVNIENNHKKTIVEVLLLLDQGIYFLNLADEKNSYDQKVLLLK
ncbi:MAG: hypothetical protein HKN51_07625 [Saprospiraceae bacterium]|nr:hypothetical protein [Saprospiraceae bacterium]